MDEGSGVALFSGLMVMLMVLLYAALIGGTVYLYLRIIRKAGYPGWYVLLMFVPVLNLVVLVMFALQEWPIERELRAARQALAARGPGAPAILPGTGHPALHAGPGAAALTPPPAWAGGAVPPPAGWSGQGQPHGWAAGPVPGPDPSTRPPSP
ncbi:hypothetical protein [Thalassiella azotivora]